jgi:hypothetical protein
MIKKLSHPLKLFLVLLVVSVYWILIGIIDSIFDKETIIIDEVKIKI